MGLKEDDRAAAGVVHHAWEVRLPLGLLAAGVVLGLGACGAPTSTHGADTLTARAGAQAGAKGATTSTAAPGATTTSTAGAGRAPGTTGPSGGGGASSPGATTSSRSTTTPSGPDTAKPPADTTTSTGGPPSSQAGTTTTVAGGTGVYGTITSGPSCPVERPDQSCPPRPVSATVRAERGGSSVGQTRSDGSGRYDLTLAPGDYTLVVDTGSSMPHCPDTQVTVTAGSARRVDISCDSGIR